MQAVEVANTKKGVRIVLAGNPNAGKTTLFNSLTHSNLRVGNFHGVTCAAAEKKVGDTVFVDSPGLYALNAYSMEEVAAADEIKNADCIINVVDCLTLESSLNLTKKLIATGKPVAVYLSKVKRLSAQKGSINTESLSKYLGVPVFTSVKQLKHELIEGINFSVKKEDINLADVYFAGNSGLKFVDGLFYNPYFSIAVFILSIVTMFALAFHPSLIGAKLKDLCEYLLCEKLADALVNHMQSEVAVSLIKDGVLGGVGGVLSFIPQLTVLYLFLTLLDESGVSSALSFTLDGLFEKVNLSGRAAFSLVSGFGCTAAAIMTTRGYATQSAQKRTVAVLSYVPCGAKLPVFLTFLSPLFQNPFPVICCLYFSALIISLLFSYLLKRGGEVMLAEVTPIGIPSFKEVLKKLYFYLKGFIIKVSLIVLVFCVVSWFFSHFSYRFDFVPEDESMLASLSKILLPVFYPMGVDDWRIAYAALCGFIAKENIAATIVMLMPEGINLSFGVALPLCAFVLLAPACVSAFSASVKEVGLKFTLKYYSVQTVIAFVGAYVVHLIFLL